MKNKDLHTAKETELSRNHKDILGMGVPEGYFTKSKSEIMAQVSGTPKKKTGIFYMKPAFRYAAAAVLIIVLGLGIFLKFLASNDTELTIPDTVTLELAGMEDEDYLITSLLVNDQQIEVFLDHYLMEGIVVKAELEEQKFDNVFMNSLIVNDSLIDTYIDDQFIENIIL